MLLKAAPDLVDARDEDGYTALHLAVIAGNRGLIKTLLVKKSDVNSLDNERHSVVHWATVCGEVEALELVLDAGARASTPDIHGGYPIHYAAQMCGPNSEMGNDVRFGLAVLRKLLARGVAVNVTDRDGRQPILWAASAGSADAILALVNAGANVEADDKDGLTALHCAASRGHTDCLETLVTLCGAEVDVIDSNGCTSLFYAVTLGHADSTQLLLGFAAEPNRQDRKGRTPAHCGAAKGQLETLRILGAHGANLWVRNVKGDYPLHDAVSSGRKDLVRWLLAQRPDAINSPNNDGRCPLHIAAINNNVEMCKIVMDCGALLNPTMRTSKGQMMTPLDAALHRGNRGCAKYLQLHGGVPASKLTDKAAKLRGGTHRVAMSETQSEHYTTPDLGVSPYGLYPGVGTPIMSVSPIDPSLMMAEDGAGGRLKRGDNRFLQVRLNDDVAIRHVERIEDPVHCRHHRYVDDSSEEELRLRRRRRRRRDRDSDDTDEEKRRRRRRRNDELSDSFSDERDHSVRRRRTKKDREEEKGSDREEDRSTRKKWTGSRQESEESEDSDDNDVSDVERKPSAKKVRAKQKTRRKEKSKERMKDRSESEGEEKRSKSRSKKSPSSLKSKKEKTVKEEKPEESSEEKSTKSKIDVKKGSRKVETLATKKIVQKAEVTKRRSVKHVPEKRSVDLKQEENKPSENKNNISETKKKESLIPRKKIVSVRKGDDKKDTITKSEEKTKGRKLGKTIASSKEKTGSEMATPKKAAVKKVSARKPSEKFLKSFEVVETILLNDSGETIQSKLEKQIVKKAAIIEEIKDDTTQRVVTAIIHHEQESVNETNKGVGESVIDETVQSTQESGDTVGEQESAGPSAIEHTDGDGSESMSVRRTSLDNTDGDVKKEVSARRVSVEHTDVDGSGGISARERTDIDGSEDVSAGRTSVEHTDSAVSVDVSAGRTSVEHTDGADSGDVSAGRASVEQTDGAVSVDVSAGRASVEHTDGADSGDVSAGRASVEHTDGAESGDVSAGRISADNTEGDGSGEVSASKESAEPTDVDGSGDVSARTTESTSGKETALEEGQTEEGQEEESSENIEKAEGQTSGESTDRKNVNIDEEEIGGVDKAGISVHDDQDAKSDIDIYDVLLDKNTVDENENLKENAVNLMGEKVNDAEENEADEFNDTITENNRNQEYTTDGNSDVKDVLASSEHEKVVEENIDGPNEADEGSVEESLISSYRMGEIKTNEGKRRKKRSQESETMKSSESSQATSHEHEALELESFLENERVDTQRNGTAGRSVSTSKIRKKKGGVVDEEESRSRSRSEGSTSRSRNGGSSLLHDSGFEPSPRRDKSAPADQTGDTDRRGTKTRKRISRPCRTDNEDDEKPSISTVSVTQAVQNSIRKYHLERSIFQELLELKRLQIRSGRANEQLLVKRLVDDYRKAGLIVGRRQYDGVYTYRNFEKYLYDQLRVLQTVDRRLIPRIKSTDDLEKLTKALKTARLTPLMDEVPDNPIFCTHGTHRCHHAAHAYTGVPCAAYIPKLNHHQMPKSQHPSKGFLPRIDSTKNGRTSGLPRGTRYVDPSRPVTLELSHGGEKQVISLPTEALDKSKRYYVTFTIKGGEKGESREEKEKEEPHTKDKEEEEDSLNKPPQSS